MDAFIAIEEAAKQAATIKESFRPDLSLMITDDFLTQEYWMDRISPTAWFSSERELTGFVFLTMYRHALKKTEVKKGKEQSEHTDTTIESEMRSININACHVLDVWTERITKNNFQNIFDYIKLDNGVMIMITEKSITIYDADDLEIPNSAIAFRNITTREKNNG